MAILYEEIGKLNSTCLLEVGRDSVTSLISSFRISNNSKRSFKISWKTEKASDWSSYTVPPQTNKEYKFSGLSTNKLSELNAMQIQMTEV